MNYSVDDIKRTAAGRWCEILSHLGGVPSDQLNEKRHFPCPKCGGKDRFRLLSADTGALFCNKCFDSQNGDGIAALMWLNAWEFQTALAELAEFLGIRESTARSTVDPVERMAGVKSCPEASLREYGGRAEGSAVVFPAFGPDREQCTTFTVWPGVPPNDKRSKGKFAAGKPAGLFFPFGDQGPHFPTAGETWFIVEGVKDAAALHGLGYLACGLNTDNLASKFVTLFHGANVVIIPDRTTSAESKARQSAALLHSVAALVKIAALPLPIDGDKGDDCRDVLKLREGEQQLRRAISNAAVWHPNDSGNIRRVPMQQAVNERLESYRNGPIPRVELGIGKLDRKLGGGIPYGTFGVVGALSSHGKTAFALQSTHHITRAEQLPTTFISVEMSVGELADRTMSYASDAPKENWHQLLERLEHDSKIHFENAAPCMLVEGLSSLADIEREITDAFESGSRVAIVDYAQLIDAGSRDDTNGIMRRVSATFKRLAKDHNAIVICLAQLNKRVEERNPLVPRLTDIEYGSKLGHDADVVLFLVWPHRIDQSKPADVYQVFVEKNRNGLSKFAVNCRFNPPRQRITEADPIVESHYERELYQ